MKAVVYEKYGSPDVLELREVPRPSVRDGEALIEVRAAALTPFDWHFLTGEPFMVRLLAGLFKPKHQILGSEVAGQVQAVGTEVKGLQPGDEVLARCEACGGYAEFVSVPVVDVWHKPEGMSFAEAAAVHFSAMTALICLCQLGGLKAGHRVLINGASGGVGTMAVPIAKSLGAEVTAVCSTKNLDLVRALGADEVIDYTREDFTRQGQRYDLIFDAVAKRSFADCRRVLEPDGIYVLTEFSPALLLQAQWISRTGRQKMVPMPPRGPSDDTARLFEEYLQAGHFSPVIDSCFPLTEVHAAFRHYERGHTQGRVVLTL